MRARRVFRGRVEVDFGVSFGLTWAWGRSLIPLRNPWHRPVQFLERLGQQQYQQQTAEISLRPNEPVEGLDEAGLWLSVIDGEVHSPSQSSNNGPGRHLPPHPVQYWAAAC
ncbi:hypothetical protein NL676_003741 [Syzygium grande]|nr:hypothetical protein NL676_003741 [Syzygium grande]